MTHVENDVRIAGIKFPIVVFGVCDRIEILQVKIKCEKNITKMLTADMRNVRL